MNQEEQIKKHSGALERAAWFLVIFGMLSESTYQYCTESASLFISNVDLSCKQIILLCFSQLAQITLSPRTILLWGFGEHTAPSASTAEPLSREFCSSIHTVCV